MFLISGERSGLCLNGERRLRGGPAAFVVSRDASSEDFEECFDVAGGAGSVDDGEDAGTERGAHLADFVALGAGADDGDHGGSVGESGEDVEESVAAFGGLGGVAGLDGETKVHECDVDGQCLDDLGGLLA